MSRRLSAPFLFSLTWVILFVTLQNTKSKTRPTFISKEISQTPSESVRIAFFIQAYSETIHLLPSLLDVLWDSENIYAIHIDAKVSDESNSRAEQHVQKRFHNASNIIFMRRQHVTYFGITTVLNTIDAITLLLYTCKQWDFFINLSASDYPLVTPKTLRQMLSIPKIIDNKLNFLQLSGPPETARRLFYDARLQHMYVDTALWANMTKSPHTCGKGCLWKSPLSDHPLLNSSTSGKLPLVQSEAWVIAHRSFARFCAHSPPARRLVAILSSVPVPEELYFGTLLYLERDFIPTLVGDAFRFLKWMTPTVRRNGTHPVVLDDIPVREFATELEESGALFARKRRKPASDFTLFVDRNLSGVEWRVSLNGSSRLQMRGRRSAARFTRTVRRRIICMVHVKWKWGIFRVRFLECMRSSSSE